jgi:hypothetical protein
MLNSTGQQIASTQPSHNQKHYREQALIGALSHFKLTVS